jgi:hypothetical protein
MLVHMTWDRQIGNRSRSQRIVGFNGNDFSGRLSPETKTVSVG